MAGQGPVAFSNVAICPWRAPMPPKQRFGSDQERPPPASGEQAAECSQDRSIGGPVPHAGVELALENPDLVSEHHDLDVFV